jgi:hypothetical protein
MVTAVKEQKDEGVAKLGSRLWRLNNLYWIMNDQGERIQFKMNPIQYALYMALWWLNIILKSRQHGITTFCCIFFLDAVLFNSNVRAGIVCHKLDDAKRIFRDKVKYAYDNLPEDLKAERYLLKEDVQEMLFSNNSSIYVSVSMRSGTLQLLHISELDYMCVHDAQKADEVKSGTIETVHERGMIIIESTQEGIGTDFDNMCRTAEKLKLSGAKLTRLDYKFHFFPWYKKEENVLYDDVLIDAEMLEYFRRIEAITGDIIERPHRNWYVKKKETLGTKIFKQHPSTPEEARHASLLGAYVGHEMVKVKERNRIGDFPHEKSAQVFTFWDVGSIHTAIWYWQFIGETIRSIEVFYDNTGEGLTEHIKMVKEKPYIYASHWCGWELNKDSGTNRKNPTTGNYILDEAENLGITFNVLAKVSFDDRIAATRLTLDKCYFNKETTEIGVSALFNHRAALNRALSTEDRPVYSKNAVPGPQAHIFDAFSHGALAYINHIYMDGKLLGDKRARIVSRRAAPPQTRTLLRGFKNIGKTFMRN